jgi:hypothetical protein
MTLTDFLLARIAEDETNLREMTNPREAAVRVEGASAPEVRHFANPDRVLAECEAKRRIVEAHREWDDNDWQSPAYFSAPMDLVLSLLALPYADHPDYREEWKP